MDTKGKTLKLRSSSNGESIDFAIGDYSFETYTDLICDHPGEGHALIKGKEKDGKVSLMMINLNERDPLAMVFHKFLSPVKNIETIHSSRYMNYFLLTFTEKTSLTKKYLLLNPGNKEIRVQAKEKPYEITFKAEGHASSQKKEFELKMKIEGSKIPETKIE